MYNLFVTSQTGAWRSKFYEYDRSRFLEYTTDDIANLFESLSPEKIEVLVGLPSLFAYEGNSGKAYIGSLKAIRERGRTLLIEFTLDKKTKPIPFSRLRPIAPLLDIRDWEMHRTHWAVKDEDLFQRLSDANLLTVRRERGQGSPKRPSAQSASYTEIVKSLGEFVGSVLTTKLNDKETFFRGHSNAAKYKLEPSLFRKDSRGNYLYLESEDTMYRELLVSNSIDFKDDHYTLDRLIRMQHYSLPTRLLDITSNPLIALYFACKSNADDIGEVICFAIGRRSIKYFDSDTASCMANVARMPRAEKEAIDFSINNLPKFNRQLPVKRLIHFVKEEKSFFEPRIQPDHLRSIVCVKGKRSNDRISFQSGAFLLFGLDAVLDEKGSPDIAVRRIAVANKNEILNQLDMLNINESTVFPYIENSARYIAQKYSFLAKEKS